MTTPEFWDALEERQPSPLDGSRAFPPNSVDAPADSVIAEVQGGYHIGQESPNHLSSILDFDGTKMALGRCQTLPHDAAEVGKGVIGDETGMSVRQIYSNGLLTSLRMRSQRLDERCTAHSKAGYY